ncbi:hypothetical protein SETIT_2G197400v2 [Setaria italica]|uniref:Uncharacterized protein n=2 Tax=Setaria TaxID=4554 RepID=A0A368Q2Y2_SETIT|nr:hypothetical protein SETIT_2G197400v2 [Setaria italica]TKW33018.1 hypothetical protein SEVIR_2G205100v2 [Setaria viridis]
MLSSLNFSNHGLAESFLHPVMVAIKFFQAMMPCSSGTRWL